MKLISRTLFIIATTFYLGVARAIPAPTPTPVGDSAAFDDLLPEPALPKTLFCLPLKFGSPSIAQSSNELELKAYDSDDADRRAITNHVLHEFVAPAMTAACTNRRGDGEQFVAEVARACDVGCAATVRSEGLGRWGRVGRLELCRADCRALRLRLINFASGVQFGRRRSS